MTRRLTESEKRKALKRYQQGETLTAIGRSLGVTRSAVGNMLRRLGTPMRQEGKLDPDQRAEVVRRYKAGESQQDLAEVFGVTVPSIRSLLTRRSVELRRPARTLDQSAFDVLNEAACYWAGFIFADGSVNSKPGKTPRVSVGLAIRDKAHLESLRDFLESSNAVYLNEERGCCQFSITSDVIAGRLIKLGRYADVIDAELTASRHFWRGVVDGDGSVGSYPYGPTQRPRPQVRVVGRLALLRQFTAFLARNRMPALRVRPHKTIFSVGTTGSPAAEIACLLYADASVALARKAKSAAALMDRTLVESFRHRTARLSSEEVAQLALFDEPSAIAA